MTWKRGYIFLFQCFMNVQTLRKAIASVSASVLLLSTFIVPGMGVNVASAQSSHWAYAWAQQLMDEGVVAAGDVNNLDATATRGFFTKVVGYVAGLWFPEDVDTDAKLGDEAVSQGILFGQNNDKTKLGLNDPVNRAEAVTIGMRAFSSISLFPSEGSLSDLNGSDWFVIAAKTVVRGGGIVGRMVNGVRMFAASGNITKGETVALAFQFYRANEVARYADDNGEDLPSTENIVALDALDVYNGFVDVMMAFTGETPTPSTVSGTLTVVDRGNPGPSVVADGTVAQLLAVDLMNGTNQEITITGLDVMLSGIATDSNIDSALVYSADGSLLTSRRSTFTDNKGTIGMDLKVAANSTLRVHIALNIRATMNSGTVGVALTGIQSNVSQVSGLPTTPAIVQVVDGATSISTVNFRSKVQNATPTTASTGVLTKINVFEFTNGIQPVTIDYVNFKRDGSAGAGEIENVQLTDEQTGDKVSDCEVRSDLNIYCKFGAGRRLDKGATWSVVLWGQVPTTADAANKTVLYSVQYDFNVGIIDQNSGQHILPVGTGGFPVGFNVNGFQIEAERLVVSKASQSPTGDVAPGSTKSVAAAYTVEPFNGKVRVTDLQLDFSGGTALAADFTATVTVAMTTDAAADPLAGTTILSKNASDANLTNGVPVFDPANNIILEPGKKYYFYVLVTMPTTATTGRVFTAKLDIRGERFSSGSQFTVGVVTANQLTIRQSTIKLATSSTFSATTLVAGITNALIGVYEFQVGTDEGQTITNANVLVLKDGVASATGITNLRLVRMDQEGTPLMGTTKGSISTSANTFSPSAATGEVKAGTTARIGVYVDFTTAAVGTYQAQIVANGINFTGKNTSNSRTLPAAVLNSAGSLVAASEDLFISLPSQATRVIARAGQTDIEVWRGRLESKFAGTNLLRLNFYTGNGFNTTTNWTLKKSNGDVVASGGVVVNNIVSFNQGITLAKDSETTYSLVTSTTNSGTLQEGMTFTAHLAGVKAAGNASGSRIYPSLANVSSTLLSSTNSDATFASGKDLILTNTGAAGVPDPSFIVTANSDAESDISTTLSLNGAVTPVAVGTQISDLAYDETVSVTTGAATAGRVVVPAATPVAGAISIAAGTLVFVRNAVNTGLGVVTVTQADVKAAAVLSVWFENGAAATNVTLATNDVVAIIAVGTMQTVAGGNCPTAVSAGQVAFIMTGTAANNGLTVVHTSVAAAGACTGANVPFYGVTLANTNVIATFASKYAEAPSASANNSYQQGGVLVFANGATPANSGLFIADASIIPGESLLNAASLLTGVTMTANDHVAVLALAAAGEPTKPYSVVAVPSIDNSGVSAGIAAVEELMGKLVISNPGTREMQITAIRGVSCTGSLAADTGIYVNNFRISVNGSRDIAFTRSDAGAQDCRTIAAPITFTFAPETVSAGGSISLWFYFNTAGAVGGYQTKSISLRFAQNTAKVGACVVTVNFTPATGGGPTITGVNACNADSMNTLSKIT